MKPAYRAIRAVISTLSLAACTAVFAQGYPNQPITMIVPFAPGGNLDITARAVAPALQKQLGQTVVVENKPGAGGSIGAGEVKMAKPDGYTILVTTPNAIAVVPYMAKTNYSYKDFRSIGLVASTPLIIDVNAKGKYQDIKQLMHEACANPDKVMVGHSGIGTTNYIGLIHLEESSGCQFQAVPYKGSGPALIDLIGSQTDAIVDQLSSSATHLRSGKLKALAVMTAKRVPALPEVPTLQEAGIKGIDASTNTGLLVPKDTPDAIVKKLNTALQAAVADPDVRKVLSGVGSEATPSAPEVFYDMILSEDKAAAKLAKAGKLVKQ